MYLGVVDVVRFLGIESGGVFGDCVYGVGLFGRVGVLL